MITWNFVAKAEIEDERTRHSQVFKSRSGRISTTDLIGYVTKQPSLELKSWH
jgi:hypothetical protein